MLDLFFISMSGLYALYSTALVYNFFQFETLLGLYFVFKEFHLLMAEHTILAKLSFKHSLSKNCNIVRALCSVLTNTPLSSSLRFVEVK